MQRQVGQCDSPAALPLSAFLKMLFAACNEKTFSPEVCETGDGCKEEETGGGRSYTNTRYTLQPLERRTAVSWQDQ